MKKKVLQATENEFRVWEGSWRGVLVGVGTGVLRNFFSRISRRCEFSHGSRLLGLRFVWEIMFTE